MKHSSGYAWYPQMHAENVIGRTHLVTVLLGVGKGNIRTWTKQRQAWILRTVPERIPSDWLTASTFHTVAPKTATCSVVGVSQSSHIPNPIEMGTDVTRLHRLHEAVKVEAVSVAQKGSKCGKLPLCHRHGNVKSPI